MKRDTNVMVIRQKDFPKVAKLIKELNDPMEAVSPPSTITKLPEISFPMQKRITRDDTLTHALKDLRGTMMLIALLLVFQFIYTTIILIAVMTR